MNSREAKIIEQSISFAKARMKSLHSSHGWDHVERVLKIAIKIGNSEKDADPFILKVSAILHDISRDEQDKVNGSKCHAELGSIEAYDFLLQQGLDTNRAKHISDCILTHRYRNNLKPASIEAKILYDADKLDSIGAIGIGRAFLFAGEIGAMLHNNSIDIENTVSYSKDDTAYREFTVKLRHIRNRMITDMGKELAEERHQFMELFFSRLQNETDGRL